MNHIIMNKRMKRNKFLLLIVSTVFALNLSLVSCSDDDDNNFNPYRPYNKDFNSIEWTLKKKDSIISALFEKERKNEEMINNKGDVVVNNPDESRKVFIPIGYNGLNVYQYLEPGEIIDSLVVDSLIKQARAKNYKTALLVSGNSGSGKSTSMQLGPLKSIRENTGFVSDQTFESIETLRNMIYQLKANGINDITIALIYRDAKSSYYSACQRLVKTGRSLALDYFCYMYETFKGRIDSMENHEPYKSCRRIYVVNNNGTGYEIAYDSGTGIGKVPTEGSVQGEDSWCYEITENHYIDTLTNIGKDFVEHPTKKIKDYATGEEKNVSATWEFDYYVNAKEHGFEPDIEKAKLAIFIDDLYKSPFK